MSCKNCDDTGWVCEVHTDRPWGGFSDAPNACDCGAGDPCPACRRDAIESFTSNATTDVAVEIPKNQKN